MKPRDAIKLASSLCDKVEQPIKRENQQHVTSRIRDKQTPANCISLVSQNIPKQTRTVDFRINCVKSSMANNQVNLQTLCAIYHRVNTKPVDDGDTDLVIGTSRADSLPEIKIAESE